MKKKYIQISSITILTILLIIPGAFFINLTFHEYYHVLKNNPYSESICFDLTQPEKAYTIIHYPDLETKLLHSNEDRLKEEQDANMFARIISSAYVLLVGVVTIVFIASIKSKER